MRIKLSQASFAELGLGLSLAIKKSALCTLCIMRIMHYAHYALCTLCIMHIMNYAHYALCTLCIMHIMHYANYAICTKGNFSLNSTIAISARHNLAIFGPKYINVWFGSERDPGMHRVLPSNPKDKIWHTFLAGLLRNILFRICCHISG